MSQPEDGGNHVIRIDLTEEHMIMLFQGHVLQINDPAINQSIEIVASPDIGWGELIRLIIDANEGLSETR